MATLLHNENLENKLIKMFWVYPNAEEENVWVWGRVISRKMGRTGFYKVKFFEPTHDYIRLVDLDNISMRPFWEIISVNSTSTTDIKSAIHELNKRICDQESVNWLQCENNHCNLWHKLPNGIKPSRFVGQSFTCSSVIWDSSVKTCTKAVECGVNKRSGSSSASKRPELSLYEKRRLVNVQRNKSVLDSLFPPEEKFQALFGTQSSHATALRPASRKRKRLGSEIFPLNETRQSPRSRVPRSNIFTPTDFRITKKRDVRRDCPVIFKGVMKKKNVIVVKGGKLFIEWEMEDPRSARGGYIYLAQKHGRVDDLYVVLAQIDATTAKKQSYTFPLPLHIPVGKDYFIEIGNTSPHCFGRSELFQLDDPVGFCLESDIGVWCAGCSSTRHYIGKNGYKGSWLTCTVCHSWQHEDCYPRKRTKKADFMCTFCSFSENHLNPVGNAQGELNTISGGASLAKAEERKRKKTIENMLQMISKTARYRRKFTKLCSTPEHVAQFLQKILQDYDMNPLVGQKIIDLGAGHGALTKVLPAGSLAVEILENRYRKGKDRAPHAVWVNEDVFSSSFYKRFVKGSFHSYDFIVSNPDFEVALRTIYIASLLLKKGGKMFFLLPSDFFEASPARTRVYKILNCSIEKEYKLGHLAFYEDNRNAQKLSTDSIFVLTHGRMKKYEYTVINSRLAGMLRAC